MTLRCRFAPSPTGYLHVGSARTALFNWLFARQAGASFVLRIEDTDASRNQPELVDNILRALEWMGIDWDEGPFHQSDRADRHREAVGQLLAAGHAYVDEGAVRLKVPDDGVTGWDDVVRGRVEFDNANLEDFVIRRSNGTPMFLLANAVDDLDMGITHVIRGEDMVNNVPKQLVLMRALGVAHDPTYAHLPLLVDDRRRKLSKRFGDVAVESYRARGFLGSAVVNYLATLGWGAPDGIEIRPIGEIVELFRLDAVNKASAFFDVQKLTHVNHEHVRAMPLEAYRAEAASFVPSFDLGAVPDAYLAEVQGRTHVLEEVTTLIDWLFLDEPSVDAAAWEKVARQPTTIDILEGALAAYADCPWNRDELHARLGEVGEKQGLKLAKAQAPVRVAVTGRTVSPPLFDGMEVLGRERTLARLRAARSRL